MVLTMMKSAADMDNTNITDDIALQQAASGDQEAFGILYERYIARIYNYIYYRTGQENEAEDLTAKVFHRAYQHIHRYKNMGVPFSAWLYRIAHNLVANWHRDNNRKKEVPLEDNVEADRKLSEFPEAEVIAYQQLDMLMKRLRMLNAERQQLIILKFVEQLSNAEIGVIMGRSEGAIKSLYHRTLNSLRLDVEEMDIQS
jgi:RNA polymerase sigma-70 factor (ECF subfamily)